MGGKKNHSWRPGKSHQDIGAPRRRTPLDSDTDMFGSPSPWCKKKKPHHYSEAKGHRSRKGAGVSEEPRQKEKHRFFHSPFHRIFGTTSHHRHRKTTTATRETRARHGFGIGYSTPPPPPPPPLKHSSPYTPNRYLHSQSDMGMTPRRSFRRAPYRTPTSPTSTRASPCSASGTPSTTSSTPRPTSNHLNPTCESCFKTHHLNFALRRSLLAHTRDIYTVLESWSDDVGCGEGTQGFVDPMEWQPEKAAVVIEKERRPSEMCRVLMKMGSVDDWVGVMRGLKEKEGGLGGQKMEGVKEGDGEGVSGLWGIGNRTGSGYRRMAVDQGGGQG